MQVPITKVDLSASDHQAVLKSLNSGWLVQGPQVAAFEASFKSYTQCQVALATTSCTTALHLALVAAGVQPGDEVIVPAFTWIATANVVEHLGAKPVFIDVDLKTYNLDLEGLDNCLSPRTRAILPVSLFGLSAELFPILDWADKHSLVVIEDAACALGSYYHGRHAGTLCDFGCFSFHPRKTLTTGEGGMLTTSRPDKLEMLKSLRDHGASQSDLARHHGPQPFVLPDFRHAGFNYRMTDLQGALGASQMQRIEQLLEGRNRWAQLYLRELHRSSPWLRPPHTPDQMRHAYQSFVCLYAPEPPTWGNVKRLNSERNQLMSHLQHLGISTRPGTHCLHTLHYYAEKYGLRPEDFPNAYLCEQLTLALPLYASMTAEEHNYVLEGLQAWAQEHL